MARRRPDDEGLFRLPAAGRGRVEKAVNSAILAARKESTLGPLDDGLITLARAQARAVDVAEAARDVWALARVSSELRESLIRLRLDPTSRGASRDQLADLLRSLGEPTPGDPAGPAPVGDPPHPR